MAMVEFVQKNESCSTDMIRDMLFLDPMVNEHGKRFIFQFVEFYRLLFSECRSLKSLSTFALCMDLGRL